MSDESSDYEGDWTRVASFTMPTEAHLLVGVLEAAGLKARLADANLVQADSWMTQALGGVRVLVPAVQVKRAGQVIAEFNAGAYLLEGETETPEAALLQQPTAVFSPDLAAVLAFFLTPVFAVGVQILNTLLLRRWPRMGSWVWLAALLILSIAGTAAAVEISPGPWVVFQGSMAVSAFTVIWYFVSGRDQSKALLTDFGPRYAKRSLWAPALCVAAIELALGWVASGF